MEVTLGIDIGGSTTKIAALLDRKQLLASPSGRNAGSDHLIIWCCG